MKHSLWRRPYFIDLTYAENFRLVKESIRGKHLKILEVGSGTGFMSLELARMGHNVTAIEHNKDLVRLAEHTKDTDPYWRTRGELAYNHTDFETWHGVPETYDIVIFSRVLHDMTRPDRILTRACAHLKARGKIVCLEYAYDMMNRRAATWLYQTRRFLEVADWSTSPHLSEKPEVGVDSIVKKNLERKEHINTFEQMRRPLKQLFYQKRLSWHCYYFWDILTNMWIPDGGQEERVATLLRSTEAFLIKSGEIQPVLFRFAGTKKP
jgi:ubiquinone/menaquinone biosynthesis C-methylase UbiE